jgi:hypothetical protein
VDVARLREQAKARGVFTAGDGLPAITFADWNDVAALLDVAEAARVLFADLDARPLEAALARLDFGDA